MQFTSLQITSGERLPDYPQSDRPASLCDPQLSSFFLNEVLSELLFFFLNSLLCPSKTILSVWNLSLLNSLRQSFFQQLLVMHNVHKRVHVQCAACAPGCFCSPCIAQVIVRGELQHLGKEEYPTCSNHHLP